MASCTDHALQNPGTSAILANRSVNPSLVRAMPGFENLEILPLISSDDKLEQSPDFVFGGQPDGAGLLKNPDGNGGYILINNHGICLATI